MTVRKVKKRAKRSADSVLTADADVARAAAPLRESRAVKLAGRLSEVGDQPPLRILCGAVIAAGLVRRDARLARAGGRMLAAHTLATLAKSFIKHRVDRTRPSAMLDGEGGARPRKGHSHAKAENSFPSGHSAGAIAVAQAFVHEYPEHRAAAFAGAGAIALAQIPRCAHYPTDVGAGLAIGSAAAAVVNIVVDLTAGSRDREPIPLA